jgi:hypothetical protein
MDPIAITLVLTFIVMLGSAAMTIPFQSPPLYRRRVSCPEDRQEAAVAFSWNAKERRMAIVTCDHRNGPCHESCSAGLQSTIVELRPSVVLP